MRRPHLPLHRSETPKRHRRTRSHHIQNQRRPTLLLPRTRIAEEDAVSIIVDGFCKQVFRELPMEFAVEAKKLLDISLEGSVG